MTDFHQIFLKVFNSTLYLIPQIQTGLQGNANFFKPTLFHTFPLKTSVKCTPFGMDISLIIVNEFLSFFSNMNYNSMPCYIFVLHHIIRN